MKNVVITGSTRGIGFSMAKEFLKNGCNVTLSGRGEALSENAQAELSPYEGKYLYVPCNVQDKKSIQNLWDESCKRWGSIDIWINNAGQNTPYTFSWETEEAYTKSVINTNVLGMIFGSQIAAKAMIKQGYGAIYSMEGLGSDNRIQEKTILYGTEMRINLLYEGTLEGVKGYRRHCGKVVPGHDADGFHNQDARRGAVGGHIG